MPEFTYAARARNGDFGAFEEIYRAHVGRVHALCLRMTANRDRAVFVVRDEGSGFDPSSIPDPTDPANLEKVSGRGLLLINAFTVIVLF